MSIGFESSLIASLLVFVMVISIGGNLLVICATIASRQLRKYANLLIFNLSISDLLITCVNLPLRISQYMGYDVLDGIIGCQMSVALTIFLFTAANFNLFILTLDRFFGVLYPLRYKLKLTNYRFFATITCGWFGALVVGAFPFFGWGRKTIRDSTTQKRQIVCTFASVLKPGYVIFIEIGTLILPWTVMITLYSFILRIGFVSARSFIRSTIHRTEAEHPNGRYDAKKVVSRKQSVGQTYAQELRMAKAVFVILSLYSILMVPIGMMDLIDTISGQALVPYTAIKIGLLMAYANPAVNPPIYAISNSRYRKVFLKLLKWNSALQCVSKTMQPSVPNLVIENRNANANTDLIRLRNLTFSEQI